MKAKQVNRSILFTCITTLLVTLLHAQEAPLLINYQGKLTDQNGVAVEDRIYLIRFALYADSADANPLWSDILEVEVKDGVFNEFLGRDKPLDRALFTQKNARYLGIKVEGEPEMRPRFPLSSVPYAINIEDEAVTSNKIKNGAVTSEKIADGQVVKSINSLKDNVILKDGENVDIIQNGDTLIIASTGDFGNTLNDSYNQGGPGAGRTIIANAGSVRILGDEVTNSGLVVERRLLVGRPNFTEGGEYAQLESFGSGLALNLNQSEAKDIFMRFNRPPTDFWSVGTKDNGDFWISNTANLTAGAALTIKKGNGRVGIGTANPNQELEIMGDLQFSGSGGETRQIICDTGDLSLTAVPQGGNGDIRVRIRQGNRFQVDNRDTNTDLFVVQHSGNVGIGTRDPSEKLEVLGDVKLSGAQGETRQIVSSSGDLVLTGTTAGGNGDVRARLASGNRFAVQDSAGDLVTVLSTGNVGIGELQPTEKLLVNGNIHATGTITQGSSSEFKENIADLSVQEAITTLNDLNPVKFHYKEELNKDIHVGFIAEEVPNLVASPDRKGINPMDIVAVLTKVVQEQQKTISALEKKVKALEKQIE